MKIPKCSIKNCENNALVEFGGKFICGNCYMKIYEKQMNNQQKMIDELEEESGN